MAGALHRSTFATREVDDDDDEVRVDFSIFDRKKKIRYTLVVIKTDVFFFFTKPSYFRIHILLVRTYHYYTSMYDKAKKRTPL